MLVISVRALCACVCVIVGVFLIFEGPPPYMGRAGRPPPKRGGTNMGCCGFLPGVGPGFRGTRPAGARVRMSLYRRRLTVCCHARARCDAVAAWAWRDRAAGRLPQLWGTLTYIPMNTDIR